jgi:hypothetical protein
MVMEDWLTAGFFFKQFDHETQAKLTITDKNRLKHRG